MKVKGRGKMILPDGIELSVKMNLVTLVKEETEAETVLVRNIYWAPAVSRCCKESCCSIVTAALWGITASSSYYSWVSEALEGLDQRQATCLQRMDNKSAAPEFGSSLSATAGIQWWWKTGDNEYGQLFRDVCHWRKEDRGYRGEAGSKQSGFYFCF